MRCWTLKHEIQSSFVFNQMHPNLTSNTIALVSIPTKDLPPILCPFPSKASSPNKMLPCRKTQWAGIYVSLHLPKDKSLLNACVGWQNKALHPLHYSSSVSILPSTDIWRHCPSPSLDQIQNERSVGVYSYTHSIAWVIFRPSFRFEHREWSSKC